MTPTALRLPEQRSGKLAAPDRILPLILLLLLATGLRFYNLDTQSFWNDEGNSARLSERSLPLIIEGTASDVHPPFYYVFLSGWRQLLGDSEFGLRSLSAFAGVLTVAAAGALAVRLFGAAGNRSRLKTAVFAAVLLSAVNPALVYYSQETRMYALLALTACLSTLALLCWLDAEGQISVMVAYVALSTAGLYTHYFYPVIFVLQGLIVILWFARQHSRSARTTDEKPGLKLLRAPLYWLFMVAISLLLYLPWVPTFLRQTGGRAAERGSPLLFVWDSLRWMMFGETIARDVLILASIGALLLMLLAVYVARQRILVPILGVVVPIGAMYLVGTTNPAFFKFMLVGVPFLMIWLAGFLVRPLPESAPVSPIARLLALALLMLPLLGMGVSLRNLYHDPAFARDDYRAMASRIAAQTDQNPGVILDAPNQWEVFTYYYDDDSAVYPLPTGQPDPAIVEPQLERIASDHDRVYALFWGDEQQDPQRIVETWLNVHAFKTAEEWVGDVRFVSYATAPDVAANSVPEELAAAEFGDKIRLEGFTVDRGEAKRGGILPVTLYWTASQTPQERYKTFVHLLDNSGHIVAQHDSEPSGGSAPTSSWTAEEVIVDRHGILIPEDLPPGEYALIVGLYNIVAPNQRLPVSQGEGGALSLGTLSVD